VFTTDAFLSRRHATIRRDPATGAFSIEDLDSSNGTYVAIRKEAELHSNDKLRVGQHLFRFETRS
jgi:pSer/pThr/pTyr-binding forkhead associated (FHA) protein